MDKLLFDFLGTKYFGRFVFFFFDDSGSSGFDNNVRTALMRWVHIWCADAIKMDGHEAAVRDLQVTAT